MGDFLVLMRFDGGDVPVGLFPTRGSAEEFARLIGWEVPAECAGLFESHSRPVNKSIVEFEAGVPVDVEIVARFEGR